MDTTPADAGAPAGVSNEVGTLLGFCVAMFLGAFLAGYVPMCVASGTGPGGGAGSAPSARMRMLTLFGAGLLTGTALIVIIPEGIEMWLAAQASHEAERHGSTRAHMSHHSEHEHGTHGHGHHHHHWQIGAALASGFAFMLVVEKLGAGDSSGHGHAHVSVSEPSRSGSGLELGGLTGLQKRDAQKKGDGKSSTAILGLIVHAAIDGVALGASTYSGNGAVSFIIFAAIMLHKAPAAFGLSVYLASLGHHRRAVQQRLVVFSLAAPCGAVLTYYGMYVNVLGVQLQQLALVMLFSGGTFLFVATVHIMPEVMKFDQALSWNEVWATVCGTLVPIVLNVEHGH